MCLLPSVYKLLEVSVCSSLLFPKSYQGFLKSLGSRLLFLSVPIEELGHCTSYL